MSDVDFEIYKAVLHILKNGISFNVNTISKHSNVSRKTVYNKIEKYVYQDLDKVKASFVF